MVLRIKSKEECFCKILRVKFNIMSGLLFTKCPLVFKYSILVGVVFA